MAGKGQRFLNQGFITPKYLIDINNKSMLEWSVESLPLEISSKIIFIILKNHEYKFNVSSFIKKKYSKNYCIDFFFINKFTRGQSETVLSAWKQISKNERLLIFNIDTNFYSKTLKKNLLNNCDGLVGTFHSNLKRYSYAKVSKNKVIETAEKRVISNYALTGLYMFSDPITFYESATKHLRLNKKTQNEFYIAPLYNELIKKNKNIIIDKVNSINILGTPEELKIFQKKYKNEVN